MSELFHFHFHLQWVQAIQSVQSRLLRAQPPLAQRPLGGMGVHMMRNYTDELHYNVTPDGRNQLTLVKYNAFQ